MPDDLHVLPKIRDSLSYLYLEFGHLEKEHASVVFVNKTETTAIPVASLAVLLLGPGTTVTHAAMTVLAENGCSVVWVGQEATKFYACGLGETRSGLRQLRQALLWASPDSRMAVIRRMYAIRFDHQLPDDLTIEQIRGHEGVRVREAYARASRETGVDWQGRNYTRGDWNAADPINRALSAANACLNGLCHAAVVSAGYSPALGFIHTGKMLSFVYDVADFYKVEVTVPLAFGVVAETGGSSERGVRERCRSAFYKARLLDRIVPDIEKVLVMPEQQSAASFDADSALPGWLWDGTGFVPGGVNYGDPDRGEGAS